MSHSLILYATTEGQTARIAERMAHTLRDRGFVVDAFPADTVANLDLAGYDGVIIGASIHYGRHPGYLRAWIRSHRGVLAARPSAFFSVSLSAGGPGARPESAKRYLETFLRKTGWRPRQTASIAGALQYSKYGKFKTLLMRMIVGFAGGHTDASQDYEYTDWGAVEKFAENFAQQLKQG
jgi:menaquinone-dependent protoporphyrinogen oxidase